MMDNSAGGAWDGARKLGKGKGKNSPHHATVTTADTVGNPCTHSRTQHCVHVHVYVYVCVCTRVLRTYMCTYNWYVRSFFVRPLIVIPLAWLGVGTSSLLLRHNADGLYAASLATCTRGAVVRQQGRLGHVFAAQCLNVISASHFFVRCLLGSTPQRGPSRRENAGVYYERTVRDFTRAGRYSNTPNNTPTRTTTHEHGNQTRTKPSPAIPLPPQHNTALNSLGEATPQQIS